MIELMILGFLAREPLHGYLLRQRMERLHGYARSISYGTLYPAIGRLVDAGQVRQHEAPGRAGAARQVLSITDAGRASLEHRLRSAGGHDITDGHRFMVVLAFLSLLPDPGERDAVLRRRLGFLAQPAGFFYDGDRPLTAAEIADPYQQGIQLIARATSRAERAWLAELLSGHPERRDAVAHHTVRLP